MSDIAARFAERLSKVQGGQKFPNVRPRDAATMIIIDRAAPSPQVLLGRRHQGHKFMPGKFVFPGGRLEPLDRRMASTTPVAPQVEARLMQHVRRPSRERARGLVLAAIRETFEETGILLGAKMGDEHTDAVRSPGGPWDAFVAAGVVPDLAPVHFIARAITPPGLARRFDTRFFAIDASAIAARLDGVVGPDTELTELVWHPIAAAARMDMPAITTAVLEELAARIAAGFSHDLPVPFYRMMNRKRARSLL
jgi:8-oxo-dGTP pyrophosphatase MutT (NUDIX family)